MHDWDRLVAKADRGAAGTAIVSDAEAHQLNGAHFDIIIGCEVVFDDASARGVAASIAHLLKRSRDSSCGSTGKFRKRPIALVFSATSHSRFAIDGLPAQVARAAPWLRCTVLPLSDEAAGGDSGDAQKHAAFWQHLNAGVSGDVQYELYLFHEP